MKVIALLAWARLDQPALIASARAARSAAGFARSERRVDRRELGTAKRQASNADHGVHTSKLVWT